MSIHGVELGYELELGDRQEYELGLGDGLVLVCGLERDDKLVQVYALELEQRILHKKHRQRNLNSDQPYSLRFGVFHQGAELNNDH